MAKGVLLVVSLQVVESINALFIQDCQSLISSPAKLDDLALVPLSNFVSVNKEIPKKRCDHPH